jgi:hypothetical protein
MVLGTLIDKGPYLHRRSPSSDHHRHTVTWKGAGVTVGGSIPISQGSSADIENLQSIGLVAGVLAAVIYWTRWW